MKINTKLCQCRHRCHFLGRGLVALLLGLVVGLSSVSPHAQSLTGYLVSPDTVLFRTRGTRTVAFIGTAPAPLHGAATGALTDSSQQQEIFPALQHAVHPVASIPNWGAMHTATEWNRTFEEIPRAALVPVPVYDRATLTTPIASLLRERDSPETVKTLTTKLYYSTRFFGAYDLDADEFSAIHPGIDLKLAEGTPIGAIAGGRVLDVRREQTGLGLHILIEHRTHDGERFVSIFGHLSRTAVVPGDDVNPGTVIGTVGMSGNTTAPHVHLQVDRWDGQTPFDPYWPTTLPSPEEAAMRTVHPVLFIERYAQGV